MASVCDKVTVEDDKGKVHPPRVNRETQEKESAYCLRRM